MRDTPTEPSQNPESKLILLEQSVSPLKTARLSRASFLCVGRNSDHGRSLNRTLPHTP